jgi:hypothetical protein
MNLNCFSQIEWWQVAKSANKTANKKANKTQGERVDKASNQQGTACDHLLCMDFSSHRICHHQRFYGLCTMLVWISANSLTLWIFHCKISLKAHRPIVWIVSSYNCMVCFFFFCNKWTIYYHWKRDKKEPTEPNQDEQKPEASIGGDNAPSIVRYVTLCSPVLDKRATIDNSASLWYIAWIDWITDKMKVQNMLSLVQNVFSHGLWRSLNWLNNW